MMHTFLSNVVGIISGWLAVSAVLPVTNADFTYGARIFWKPFDAYYSIIKGFAFGTCITVISCYFGFSTEQGAEGVGKSTTAAVVASCVMILLLDWVTMGQILSTPMILAGLAMLVIAYRRREPSGNDKA